MIFFDFKLTERSAYLREVLTVSIFKILLTILIVVGGLITFIGYAQTSNKTKRIEHVQATYDWFNQILAEDKTKRLPITKEAIKQYFSDDAKMITNGKLSCEGIEEHYLHFFEFLKKFKSMRVNPLKSIEATQDKIWLHYTLDLESVDSKKETILVMGYMEFKDNKIALFDEVIAHQTKHIETQFIQPKGNIAKQ